MVQSWLCRIRDRDDAAVRTTVGGDVFDALELAGSHDARDRDVSCRRIGGRLGVRSA